MAPSLQVPECKRIAGPAAAMCFFLAQISLAQQVPSFHFLLAVDVISKSTVSKLQGRAMKCIKSWLGLCRSTTIAVIHHPDVLGVPYLPEFRTKAKLNFLASISSSQDPLIKNLSSLTTDQQFLSRQGFPDAVKGLLELARNSISSISRKTLGKACKAMFKKGISKNWDDNLHKLSVQSKFLNACDLEKSNRVWARILDGLPAKQLSFILRASSDTLPTPLNQRRWRMRVDAACDLCKSRSPTVLHILNFCPIALNQQRFTWRHDSVLLKLFSSLRSFLGEGEALYVDLPGKWASEAPQATVPISILVTSARPDMVLIRGLEITLIELTVPFDSRENLNNARFRKSNKSSYLELVSDLEAKGYSATLITCEISSLGHSLPVCHKDISSHPLLVPLFVPCLMQPQRSLSLPRLQYSWLAKSLTGIQKDHFSLDCMLTICAPLNLFFCIPLDMCTMYSILLILIIFFLYTLAKPFLYHKQ